MCAVIFICGNLFLRIAGKTAKIEKIRTRTNFVPHGIQLKQRPHETKLLQVQFFYISFKVQFGYPGRYFIYDSYSVLIYRVFLLVYRGTWLALVSWPTSSVPRYLACSSVLAYLLQLLGLLVCLGFLEYLGLLQ